MDSSKFGEIAEELLKHCGPYQHHGWWKCLGESAEIRGRPTGKWEDVEDALCEQFSQEDLLEARVFVNRGGLGVGLNPVLKGFGTVIAPLRSAPEAKPFDLIVENGLLNRKTAPAIAALDDGRLRERLDAADNTLCLTFSLPDMAALWSVGIPAVPATGLTGMSGKRLRKFCKRFAAWECDVGASPPQPSPAGEPLGEIGEGPAPGQQTGGQQSSQGAGLDESPDLVLVAWDLTKLKSLPPAEFDRLLAHLKRIGKNLDIDFANVYVWRPTPEDVERIGFCLEYRQKEGVYAAVLSCLNKSVTPAILPDSRPKPTDLAAGLTELVEALQSSATDSNAVRTPWFNMQSLMIEKCVTPLVEKADASSDVKARNLYLGAAVASLAMHSQGCGLVAKTMCEMRRLGPGKFAMLPQQEVRQQGSLANTLLKYFEAIEKNFKSRESAWDW